MITSCSFITIWILNILLLVNGNLQHLPGVPVMRNDPMCNEYYCGIVHQYFKETLVIPSNSTDIQFCAKRQVQRNNPYDRWEDYDTDLTEIINFYESLPQVSTITLTGGVAHIVYGVMNVNDFDRIPLFATGEIFYEDTTGSHDHNCPSTVENQMRLMGQLESDDRGHLLARSLGGSNKPINLIPMARNLNRHLANVPENTALNIPRSYWRSNEDWILRFLRRNRQGRVSWRIALQYRDVTIIHPDRYTTFRPSSLTMQFTAYADRYDNDTVEYQSPQISFFNDNDFACGFEPTSLVKLDLVNDKCEATLSFPPQPQGKLGEETDRGQWKNKYRTGFSYTIEGRTFFFCQDTIDSTYWFIQELRPNGLMGSQTDGENWVLNFPLIFTYSFNGKQYMYFHSPTFVDKSWFIHELLPDGKMGGLKTSGKYSEPYAIGFPFKIDGKCYFFRYGNTLGSYWQIQELLADGQVGDVTDSGSWSFWYRYTLVFPYVINNRHFFLGHSSSQNNWFIQELLPGGKMGIETDHGVWDFKCKPGFPYSIGAKRYFLMHDTINVGAKWFIRELLPDGKMGGQTDAGSFEYTCENIFPFVVDGKPYMYGHSTHYRKWFIRKLL